MPPIQTIARPRRNRISVSVPEEYSSYSLQVILVPLAPDAASPPPSPAGSGKRSLVKALMSCPSDISALIDDHGSDMPSFFERSGGFGSEEFA